MQRYRAVITAALLTAALVFTCWPDFHPEAVFGQPYEWWLDVIFHSSFWFVTTVFFLVLYRGASFRMWIPVALFALSVLMEAAQLYIHGRSFSGMDIGSNFMGATMALVVIHYSGRKAAAR